MINLGGHSRGCPPVLFTDMDIYILEDGDGNVIAVWSPNDKAFVVGHAGKPTAEIRQLFSGYGYTVRVRENY